MADLRPYLGGNSRPDYDSDLWHYQCVVESAVRMGGPTPPPGTTEELKWLIEAYPIRARLIMPPPDELQRLGISRNAGRTVEPWPIESRERFLRTLAVDQDFREAVAAVLGVAQ